MIVKNNYSINKYVTINPSVTYQTLEPYIRQVERTHIKPIIGPAQYQVFETQPTDDIVKEAWELCQEAIFYFAMYKALPFLSIQITEGGIFAASTGDAQQITDKQYKELLRAQKKQAHETLDQMLQFMEANLDKFTQWSSDPAYTDYASLLVNTTAIFNKHYNIFNSRQTFMALKPELSTVENQFIEPVIQSALLEALKNTQDNNNRKIVKQLLQKAIVNFTVSKVMENGLFVLDAQGIYVRFDVLPYEMLQSNATNKINDFIINTKKNKITEAEQYLKKAIEVITNNPDDFEEYTAPEETETKSTVYSTQSITLC
jgi:hypothetical protein